MSKDWIFDFTGVSEAGFVTVKPGRYNVVVDEVKVRVKAETGNVVFDVDSKIVGNAEYEGTNLRYFQTVSDKEISKGFLLQMLGAIGVISEADRGTDGTLKVKLAFGKTDDDGKKEVLGVEVNGQKRPFKGANAVAVVIKRTDGKDGHSVDKLEKREAGKTAPSNPAPDTSAAPSPPDNAGGANKNFPW